MNDNELSSMVRESVAGIRSSTPVDQIISRGHAVRTRRRVPAAPQPVKLRPVDRSQQVPTNTVAEKRKILAAFVPEKPQRAKRTVPHPGTEF